MKLLILLLSLIFLSCIKPRQLPTENYTAVTSTNTADSGYILKPQALALLLKGDYDGIYDDSINQPLADDYKDTDTIGKYYRLPNGNFFACIYDIVHYTGGAGHLLAELSADLSMIKSVYYPNGIHLCCWNNLYDGFYRKGPYYVLDICGTGSGHCSSGSVFMKGLNNIGGNSITTYAWTTMCVGGRRTLLACHLTSKPEFAGDTIIMHYTMQHLKLRRNDTFKVKHTEEFDIKYVQRDSAWIALDSTKILEFPL